jgi:phosphoribosylformylglycinamidine cyclo-ligase
VRGSDAYRRAGVDLDAAAEAVGLIGELAAKAKRPEVRDGVGGFAGLFDIGGGRLLAAATDGVGTKTEVAREAGRLATVGIDLVAMCADDVVCTGAEPLFFLDYLAVGSVVPAEVAEIVEGVAEGCRLAGCALLGGETAEHPGVMEAGRFDLGGFCVGIVGELDLLGPHRVRFGDVLIGLPSSGLHANGFSLVRSAVLGRYGLDEVLPALGRPLVDELLEPCVIYAPLVLALARDGLLHAAAHVTGGGLVQNLPRALPDDLGAEIRRGSWLEPAVFGLVGEAAGARDEDMFATFNMGIGMVLVVAEDRSDQVLDRAPGARRIGVVDDGTGARVI